MKLIIYVLLILLFFPACSAVQKTFSDGDSWIPADFDPHNTTLLIENFPFFKKANNKMIEYLNKNYPWAYEVVTEDMIRNASVKYNTTKYRFGFVWNKGDSRYGTQNQINPDGNFHDRLLHKDYPTTKKLNNYGVLAYKPFFNTIIKHFH